MAEKDDLVEKQDKDREPWSPRVESAPLFVNSADYERSLGHETGVPEIEIVGEEPEDSGEPVSSALPNRIAEPV
jgi:hypothetical protein